MLFFKWRLLYSTYQLYHRIVQAGRSWAPVIVVHSIPVTGDAPAGNHAMFPHVVSILLLLL